MRIRYTSDLHFQHALVAKLRGFTRLDDGNLVGTPDGKPAVIGDIEAHDGVIIENFNKGTRDDDLTIIAGDFAMNWKGVEAKLAQLRGRLILVEGNHDIMSSIHQNGWKYRAAWTGEGRFEAIVAFLRRKSGGREFLVSHYPYQGEGNRDMKDRYTQFRLRDEGMWLLHGHVHSRDKTRDHPRQVHVGLDAWGLKPVPEDDILALMRELDEI